MDTSPNGKEPVDPRIAVAEVVIIPPDVLARHGARVLDPSTAVYDENDKRPQSTAYRAATLLMPAGEAKLVPGDPIVDRALESLGLQFNPPHEECLRPGDRTVVPVALVRRKDSGDREPRPPVPIDAWTALVALRREFAKQKDQRQRERGLAIGLDHLVCAASVPVQGTPYSGGGAVGDGQGQASGIMLYTGSRNPVQYLGPQPDRTLQSTRHTLGRRPVVAVLDTGIGRHPWLSVGDENPAYADLTGEIPVHPMTDDPAVEVSHDFQLELKAHELAVAGATGGTIMDPLGSPWEVRDAVQPVLGLTDSHAGHGTFVTGLVHQLCPQARVLSLRVLHSDGFSTEGSLLFALDWLRRKVKEGKQIDVVSLSLGFYAENAATEQASAVSNAITELTDLGVVVVAAAGNDSTTRRFLPAAFADATRPLLAAIGARNASGLTTAAFSNSGDWISRWAPGNAMVSTVPDNWQGARGTALALLDAAGIGPRWRTAPDPDDLSTGFAVWAGTSFATPVIAGMLAAQMCLGNPAVRGVSTADAAFALAEVDKKLVERRWQDPPAKAAPVAAAAAVAAPDTPS